MEINFFFKFVTVNIDNKIGAVGFVPLCAGSLYPVGLLKVDEETGEPVRGPDGLCIRCKPGKLTKSLSLPILVIIFIVANDSENNIYYSHRLWISIDSRSLFFFR